MPPLQGPREGPCCAALARARTRWKASFTAGISETSCPSPSEKRTAEAARTGPDIAVTTAEAAETDLLDLVEAGMFEWVNGTPDLRKINQKPCHSTPRGHAKISPRETLRLDFRRIVTAPPANTYF